MAFTRVPARMLAEPPKVALLNRSASDHVVTGDYDWNSGAAQRTNVRPLNLYPAKIRA